MTIYQEVIGNVIYVIAMRLKMRISSYWYVYFAFNLRYKSINWYTIPAEQEYSN